MAAVFLIAGLPPADFLAYLRAMLLRERSAFRPTGFVEPCRPSRVPRPPSGPDWVHEIKHDGFRLMVRREGSRVRLFTRNGYDWADRFPAIVEAASTIRARSFLIDGEAVICRHDGISDFDALRSRRRDHDVVLIAFDLIELQGDDLRNHKLIDRKQRLAKMLSRGDAAISYNEHLAHDGPAVFEHACRLGLEGIVSKRLDSSYRSGPSKVWLKSKNPECEAVRRELEEDWG
jgi:bifunctional non-homologous end joining protein LigD